MHIDRDTGHMLAIVSALQHGLVFESSSGIPPATVFALHHEFLVINYFMCAISGGFKPISQLILL